MKTRRQARKDRAARLQIAACMAIASPMVGFVALIAYACINPHTRTAFYMERFLHMVSI